MNYIWTIQKKSVVEIINSKGEYYPDFHYGKKVCKHNICSAIYNIYSTNDIIVVCCALY